MRKLFSLTTMYALLARGHTIQGVGKDSKKGGDFIEKIADKAKNQE